MPYIAGYKQKVLGEYKVCCLCGARYIGRFDSKYCSDACKKKVRSMRAIKLYLSKSAEERRNRAPSAMCERTCPVCGSKFSCREKSLKKWCSEECKSKDPEKLKYNKDRGAEYRDRLGEAGRHARYEERYKERILLWGHRYRRENADRIRARRHTPEHRAKERMQRNARCERLLQQAVERAVQLGMCSVPVEEARFVIYRIRNLITGRSYIGQTCNIYSRYKRGFQSFVRYKKSSRACLPGRKRLEHDLEAYGFDSFVGPDVIATCSSHDEADILEASNISKYAAFEDGYNDTRGNLHDRKMSRQGRAQIEQQMQQGG